MPKEARVAVTRTPVFTVPDCTTVCTDPSVPDVAVVGVRESPPTVVSREKVTAWPETGPPV